MSANDHCSAELIHRIDLSDRLAVFKFLPSEGLSFIPGQYATLGVEGDGQLLERPYSIVSAPHERHLEFFVELVPGGVLSPKLWELKVGSRIWIRRRIVGHFTLSNLHKRHVMLATGTGIAPFVSIARTIQFEERNDRPASDQLLIIQGASRSSDFGPYLNELRSLSLTGWLQYIATISRPWEEPSWTDETGRVEDVLRKHADRLGYISGNTCAYVCGHPKMIENAKDILTRARFTGDNIKQEDYFRLRSVGRPATLIKRDRETISLEQPLVTTWRPRSNDEAKRTSAET